LVILFKIGFYLFFLKPFFQKRKLKIKYSKDFQVKKIVSYILFFETAQFLITLGDFCKNFHKTRRFYSFFLIFFKFKFTKKLYKIKLSL